MKSRSYVSTFKVYGLCVITDTEGKAYIFKGKYINNIYKSLMSRLKSGSYPNKELTDYVANGGKFNVEFILDSEYDSVVEERYYTWLRNRQYKNVYNKNEIFPITICNNEGDILIKEYIATRAAERLKIGYTTLMKVLDANTPTPTQSICGLFPLREDVHAALFPDAKEVENSEIYFDSINGASRLKIVTESIEKPLIIPKQN